MLLPALEPSIFVADYLISATTISTTDKEAALPPLSFLRVICAGFSMKKSVFALSLLAAATFGLCSTTYAANRDLVFEEDEETVTAPADSANETIAVKTTVQLTRNGETSNVLPDAEFQSGDRVKLLFTSNVDGYVYWLAKGTSGNYSVLFPNAKAGMSNEIKRNQEYTVPAKGSSASMTPQVMKSYCASSLPLVFQRSKRLLAITSKTQALSITPLLSKRSANPLTVT